MTTLVFFLEESSAQEFLSSFLPRFFSGYEFRYIVFEGKNDLKKRVSLRLRGWNAPDCKFIILQDKDSCDCLVLKNELFDKCVSGRHPETLIRIACSEIESWYLGDLSAIETGLGLNGIRHLQVNKKYRAPDSLGNSAQEIFNITKGRYQKVSGSREIGKHISIEHNKSHSFHVFVDGLRRIIQSP
jgi:hypothetical protein